MAVYLFTLHSYGSWMPDHAQGYTRRKQGIFPTDPHMAGCYRQAMAGDVVRFGPTAQRIIIAAVQEKACIKGWSLFAVATDPTHIHVLVSWPHFTAWLDARRGLKSSITRQLNTALHHQRWLSQGGSRRRVTNERHFNHLIRTYLPGHRGKVWIAPAFEKR